jgi:hypothetical protein
MLGVFVAPVLGIGGVVFVAVVGYVVAILR